MGTPSKVRAAMPCQALDGRWQRWQTRYPTHPRLVLAFEALGTVLPSCFQFSLLVRRYCYISTTYRDLGKVDS